MIQSLVIQILRAYNPVKYPWGIRDINDILIPAIAIAMTAITETQDNTRTRVHLTQSAKSYPQYTQ